MFYRLNRDVFGRPVGGSAQLVIGPNARTVELPTSAAFEDYVACNHRDWFSHIEAIGLDCDPSDLVCISGFTKGSNVDLRVGALTPRWLGRSDFSVETNRGGAALRGDTTFNHAGFIEFYRIQYRRPTSEDLVRRAKRCILRYWISTEGEDERTVRPILLNTITGPLIVTVGRNAPGSSIEVSTTRM